MVTASVGEWEKSQFTTVASISLGSVHVWAFPSARPPISDRPPAPSGSRHSLVRACIASYTEGRSIRHDARGRPIVGGLSVSLSSTRGLTVLALARGVEIGVDAEWIRTVEIDGPLRMLSPSERRLIDDRASDRVERALRLWTRKEAWSKLDGRGIDFSWPDITVTGAWSSVGELDRSPVDPCVQIITLDRIHACEVALAMTGHVQLVRLFVKT